MLPLATIMILRSKRKDLYNPQTQLKKAILQKMRKISESDFFEANQNHQRGSDFFSASYSGDRLFLGIAQKKIGVDLEIIKDRSTPLLEKHTPELTKHFQKADWKHFYLLRTAKEAILKASNAENLDLIDQIQLLEVKKNPEIIGTIAFSRLLTFEFQGEVFQVKSWENWTLARSVCLKND